MNKIMEIYHKLLKMYGSQGWWPIINNKTLLCEYGLGAPRNEAERLEIAIGTILTQNTRWYPNVVRAIQQLKLGRPFTKQELEVIRQAEIHKGIIREKPRKQTTGNILTQNTAWNNVEKAINNLKQADLIASDKIINVDIAKLKDLIKPAGYYNQKAERLKIIAHFFKKNKNITREKLLQIKGVGPETADSILLYALKQPYFVIDAYTKRIFRRLGITNTDNYEELQQLFEKNLKKDTKTFNEYHALIVCLGKNICRKKPLCNNCPLSSICKHNI